MKNLSIPIKYKDEAIPLLEKLGYKEDTEWNEISIRCRNTHILASEGKWGYYYFGKSYKFLVITIEELRELAGETDPTPIIEPDKLDLLIQQMRELRAELREFIKDEKPAEAQKWKLGDRVRITKKETHGFKIGDVVKLIEYRKENDDDTIPWLAQSGSRVKWWINESEAELI